MFIWYLLFLLLSNLLSDWRLGTHSALFLHVRFHVTFTRCSNRNIKKVFCFDHLFWSYPTWLKWNGMSKIQYKSFDYLSIVSNFSRCVRLLIRRKEVSLYRRLWDQSKISAAYMSYRYSSLKSLLTWQRTWYGLSWYGTFLAIFFVNFIKF